MGLKFKSKTNKKLRLSRLFVIILLATFVAALLFYVKLAILSSEIEDSNESIIVIEDNVSTYPSPSPVTVREKSPIENEDTVPTEEWGVARQIGDSTWTMKVGQDEKMATPAEIHEALNNYRNKKGAGSLIWDEGLANFAKSRADKFATDGKLDEHAGFREYAESGDNMQNLGFFGMGENSSIGFRLSGVHLIEWIFAGDPPHDDNQLDPSWTHVGIATNGTAVDVIFGKK